MTSVVSWEDPIKIFWDELLINQQLSMIQ